jgi:hypothetical protein
VHQTEAFLFYLPSTISGLSKYQLTFMKNFILILIIYLTFTCHYSFSQTCCSGGVPLANNIGGIAQGEEGAIQISINFDANILRALKEGGESLSDDSRERITYSTLLKVNYSISNKLAIEGLFSAIRQERIINHGSFTDFTKTEGLGDAVFMVYYKYYGKYSLDLTFGAGPKIPIGPSDLKNDNGITLNADLQPGSGAWDMILHHRISKSFEFRPSATFLHLITYRMTGENPDYLGSQHYELGNELQVLLGFSEQDVIGKILISYGLNFRYRNAGRDVNNNQFLPNTGGQWLFIMPAFSWYIDPLLAVTANVELPLYSEVGGTQLTPTFRFNAGIFWKLQSRKSNNSLGIKK